MAGLSLTPLTAASMGANAAQVPGDLAGLQLKQAQASIGQSQAQEEQQKVQGGLAMSQGYAAQTANQQPTNDPFQQFDNQIQAHSQNAQKLAQLGYGVQAQAEQKAAMDAQAQKRQLVLSQAAKNSQLGNYKDLAPLANQMGFKDVADADYDPESKNIVFKDANGAVVGGLPKEELDQADLTSEQRLMGFLRKFNTESILQGRQVTAEGNLERENARGEWQLKKGEQTGLYAEEKARISGEFSLKAAEARARASMAGGAGGSNAPVVPSNIPEGVHGEEAYQYIPEARRDYVRAMVEGRMLALSGFVLRSPWGATIMQEVNKVDPQFSTQRAEVRKALTTGSDGRNRAALNTASVHLDAYMEAMEGLQNGTLQPGNALYNRISTILGKPAPMAAAAIRAAVAGEQASALKGNATDVEIGHILQTMAESASPDQFLGTGKAGLSIMRQKLQTYQERFNEQLPDDTIWNAILPSAQQAFEKYGIGNTAPAAAQRQRPPAGQPPRPGGQAQPGNPSTTTTLSPAAKAFLAKHGKPSTP